jgi:S-adenosylmethionine-diacylglycerol 3-amino-3-carboxypropyl transferase
MARGSGIRYGQCWEDADVLLEGLYIQPGDVCLSIASAGDNTLAMLSKSPGRVVALDVNPAQLACLELRAAAYATLTHREMLMLMGSVTSCVEDVPEADAGACRLALYERCRGKLTPKARSLWEANPDLIIRGICGAGKFERYLSIFRRRILPLIHPRRRVQELLCRRSQEERLAFHREKWNTPWWRLLFRVFFSRAVMQRLGRDPAFFRYVEGGVSRRMLQRTRHALTTQDPSMNPYLQWILFGHHPRSLPYSLRLENFEAIRANLDRLSLYHGSLQEYLGQSREQSIDRFNLSDVFEYVSDEEYRRLLESLARAGRACGRIAYWNLLVERRRPEELAHLLLPLDEFAERLHARDKVWFYGAFVLEEIVGSS